MLFSQGCYLFFPMVQGWGYLNSCLAYLGDSLHNHGDSWCPLSTFGTPMVSTGGWWDLLVSIEVLWLPLATLSVLKQPLVALGVPWWPLATLGAPWPSLTSLSDP